MAAAARSPPSLSRHQSSRSTNAINSLGTRTGVPAFPVHPLTMADRGMGDLLALLDDSQLGIPTLIGRMALATVLGFLIGLDRELANRSAGLRTHMLVSLAAATFTLIMFELVETLDTDPVINADPIRVIEAVTAGVAFLAAGSIIQARNHVRGLTTGAGLWLAGAVGTACGIGAFAAAIAATVIGLVVLFLLRFVTHPTKEEEPPVNGDRP